VLILAYQERIIKLNSYNLKERKYIIYWMQSSHRTQYNLALDYAIFMRQKLDKPVIVYFGITNFLEANQRHYKFMFEGLQEVKESLENQGIKIIFQQISPEKGIVELSKKACLIVVDRGYLRTNRKWYNLAAQKVKCPLFQVEDNVIVPVELASNKEEYSAATFRPKINMKTSFFLRELKLNKPVKNSVNYKIHSLNINKTKQITDSLNFPSNVSPTNYFYGGTKQAIKKLELFLNKKLYNYPISRNDPTSDSLSNLSPYLHFGQISPIQIAHKVISSNNPEEAKRVFLEELIVRRELAINYVFYNKNYDSFAGLPNWTRKSLLEHKNDSRQYIYSLKEFEQAKTHDPYWNAAQNQMRFTGKMHGYMRMYWGKKIIEWTKSPQIAFEIALKLNNTYELDGRDPNGYTGVAWCFGKHDRPWKERAIFGKIRYMNDKGLRRKFDADKYVKIIKNLN
jgi:deoxyribodipyrimidine photo-lyase